MQYNFPKMKARSKAVWNFSENSSDLVRHPTLRGVPLYTYSVSLKKLLTECIRNSFDSLSLSPGDVNLSITVLVDFLWFLESYAALIHVFTVQVTSSVTFHFILLVTFWERDTLWRG